MNELKDVKTLPWSLSVHVPVLTGVTGSGLEWSPNIMMPFGPYD